MSTICLPSQVLSDLDHQTLPMPFSHDMTSKTSGHGRDQEHWFAEAQKLDPTLGTLSYLPIEIRQMIFTHALSCDPDSSADGIWEYVHLLGSPLNVSTYCFKGFHTSTIDPRIGGLRQTSSSMKAEFDDVLLSRRTFRFNDPWSLMKFIQQLDESQLARVFSIAMGVCLLYEVDDWLTAVAQLPVNLTEVQFRIYTAFNVYILPDSVSTFRNVIYEAARRVPDAKISICGTGMDPLTPDCQKVVTDFVQSQSQKPRHR